MYYKETLMGEKEGKSKGDEEKKLSAILERYDALLPKVADTRKACDSLWKSYQVVPIIHTIQYLDTKYNTNTSSASIQ